MLTVSGNFNRGEALWQRLGEGRANLHFAAANGFPAGAYRFFLNRLTDRFSIVALENRGMWPGQPVPDETLDWRDYAEDLIGFLESRQASGDATLPIVGMGHSLGGTVTLLAAVKRPDLFSRIILIDPASMGAAGGERSEAANAHLSRLVTDTLNRRAEWGGRRAFREFLPTRAAYRDFADAAQDDYAAAGLVESGDHFRLRYSPVWEAHNFARTPTIDAELAGVAVPTLLVYGENSPMYPQAFIDRLSPGLSAAVELHMLPGAGHLIPQEAPEELYEVVTGWIDGG